MRFSIFQPTRLLKSLYSHRHKMYNSYLLTPEVVEELVKLGCTENEIREHARVFSFFDDNRNGFIDASEMGDLLRTIGLNPSKDNIQKLLKEIDIGGDGKIDLVEFVKASRASCVPREEMMNDLKTAFEVFDKDKTGTLDRTELKRILTFIGEEPFSSDEADKLIAILDNNHDGVLQYEEFVDLFTLSLTDLENRTFGVHKKL